MKLTILGFSPPNINPNKATSAFLLESKKNCILIDCGHGAVSKLLEKIDPEKLTAVIISHMHPDHFYDLVALRNVFFKRKLKSIPLYMPPDGAKILLDVVKATQLPDQYMEEFFDIEEYNPDEKLDFTSLSLEMLQTIHPINTYAMSFIDKASQKKFIYTSDTAFFPNLAKFCLGADLVIIECTDQPVPDGERWHLSPKEVLDVLLHSLPKLTVITHYESSKKNEILSVVKNKKLKIEMAEEFKEFTI